MIRNLFYLGVAFFLFLFVVPATASASETEAIAAIKMDIQSTRNQLLSEMKQIKALLAKDKSFNFTIPSVPMQKFNDPSDFAEITGIRADIASTRMVLLSEIRQVKDILIRYEVASMESEMEATRYHIDAYKALISEDTAKLIQPSTPDALAVIQKRIFESTVSVETGETKLIKLKEYLDMLQAQI